MYGESRRNEKRDEGTKPGAMKGGVLIARGMLEKKKALTEARWRVEGETGYKGISSYDQFSMVINANSESDAEDKAEKALEKARDRRKIGPGGGGRLEDTEIESIQRTNDKLSEPETFRGY